MPRRDAVIDLIAETTAGIASEPTSFKVKWIGPVATARPTLYVLTVGISDYRAAELKLGLAAKDADDFVGALTERPEYYKRIEVRSLKNEQASHANLLEMLQWLARTPGNEDVAVLFLAGHGVDDPAGRYYYVPYEVAPNDVFTKGLSYADIRRALGQVAGRVLLFIDTCHSGAVWGRPASAPMDVGRIVNDLSSPELGVVVFASSTGSQLSYESAVWGNGAFTKALVEGLAGKADLFDNGVVTITGLAAYVSDRVTKLTGARQTPATGRPVEADFSLVKLR